ncbi:ATP-binding protein [Streptomyces bohaiensis]|uniref:ATP-binding protein n=1 Tax=Streptomyces bohaiensis TaxID=1431344 RepID=UPI00143C9285|nr:ATP-binding protein [Streptomyces bohaiensis]
MSDHHHTNERRSATVPGQRPRPGSRAVRARARYDGTERVAEARALARRFLSTVQTREPVAQPRDPRRIGGHGLHIVTTLCSAFQASRNHGGKRVTATLPLVSAPG